MSLLDVRNLSLRVGANTLLKDVSFRVSRGEIFGLVGESGSGKSLTALSIMQLLPDGMHQSGTIALDGEMLSDLSEREMCKRRGRDVAMVFQEPMTALNPLHTIGQQVAESIELHSRVGRREALGKAADVLERVGLGHIPLTRYPHELSGGQRQRVVIALAIALRPKVLIADEPTTALDVTTQAGILDLLSKLVREDGMAMILITHDLAVVHDMADRVAIMEKGRVAETGVTSQVLKAPGQDYTRALIAASSHAPLRPPRDGTQVVMQARDVVRDYALPRRNPFSVRPTFRAVDHVKFELRKGENLGLVGESGSGKSTLTRALLGLEPVQGGSIELGGKLMDMDAARDLRRRIGIVFQDPFGSFNPRHTVARLVAEPFHLLDRRPSKAEQRAAVGEMLESVGLNATDMDRHIHAFSGGQRQRIAIARALIIRPEIVVLDEAVSALDVQVRAQILDLLAELSDRFDVSYLFVSHDLSVVRAITDRVLVMKDGAIVEQGDTAQVFAKPSHAYTRQLIDAVPKLPI
ncbi:ABC transporter ATP-binding protein [Pontivivens insulae]|uniref:Glutathione import ATP-binding protein GsiA n=1 Tax=Pontivivens insulae TaxID=1639689 RepID=A0A2R8A8J4_9RHOB|nr:ABC transporter ATP-binding protein [Pontivivens insulae]RED18567.1 peptide/nickel transport system ATP-binding protein [Pontivivens insulae]SPF28465.1 Glutathione import ATP-binding protein GsiA [Pontivivens insulae]